MIRKILVAIDFSEGSKKAVTFARGLAEQTGSELILMTVLDVGDLHVAMKYDLSGFSSTDQLHEVVKDWVDKQFDAVAPSAKARRHVARGIADQEIVDSAESLGADLIVMGSVGIGSIAGRLLGSVAEAVVRNSVIPVAIVR